MPEQVLLESDVAQVVVLPQYGAGLARFDLKLFGQHVPVLRPLKGKPRNENELALYLMAPFSNRIGRNAFTWREQRHCLTPNVDGELFALHGDAWQQSWNVIEQTARHVRLQLQSRRTLPFTYEADITWRLDGAALLADLCLTHRGDCPMLYGGGFHPWLLRDQDTRLQSQMQGWWSEDAWHLPVAWHSIGKEDALNFKSSRTLPTSFVNTGFTGWNGMADIIWPKRGVALQIEADAPLNRCVVYSPGEHSGFFCFEPVTHDIDAHNSASPMVSGLIELAEGESLCMSISFAARLFEEIEK